MPVWKLGHILRLELSATPSAVVTYATLACIAAVIAGKRYRLSPAMSVGVGVLGAGLHASAVLVHHLGHASAAECAGHPMTGVRFWGPLATSVYPDNEPSLPPAVHLVRAAGGPITSLALAAAIGRGAGQGRGLAAGLRHVAFIDNLVGLGVGSLLPLGFTDGGTLLDLALTARKC